MTPRWRSRSVIRTGVGSSGATTAATSLVLGSGNRGHRKVCSQNYLKSGKDALVIL